MELLDRPIRIKGSELRNRLVMPPMATAKAGRDGLVTDELCSYYDERTRGGHVGLVITEHSYISSEGKASEMQVSVAGDETVEGLSRLADTLHRNGTVAILQMNHAGGKAKEAVTGCRPLGPSAAAIPGTDVVPEAMTTEDIDKVVADFVSAAKRTREAGFDGVEIHSAHGYLLNQFFSPLSNKRTDEYGGSLEGRLKLHLRVAEAVRQAVGPDFILALRLGACDYMEGGISLEDSVAAAVMLEKAGVDLLDISGGFCGYVVPGLSGQGYFAELSGPIKEAVHIPVILTGGVTEAEAADRLLCEGKADLIGVGRALLKDASWADRELG